MTKMEPLPLFYSVNRFLEHDERTGVDTVIGNLQSSVNRRSNVPVEYSIKGRMRVRQQNSRQIESWIRADLFFLSHSSHLQQVNISKRYGIKEVVLTHIGG